MDYRMLHHLAGATIQVANIFIFNCHPGNESKNIANMIYNHVNLLVNHQLQQPDPSKG